MRKMILGLHMVALVLICTSMSFADTTQFAGNWVNIDPNTRNCPGFNIQVSGANVSIQVFKLGRVPATVYADNVSANLAASAIAISGNFVDRTMNYFMLIKQDGSRLQLQMLTTYSDGRSNQYHVDHFRRDQAPEPVGLVVPQQISPANQIASKQSYKTTTILGSWTWNVESNRQGGDSAHDFWWEHVNETERYLVPLGGTSATIVEGQSFEMIDAEYVRHAGLSQTKIAGGDLKSGTIIVFRTAKGRLGKLQVVGYKALHDFDFPEAAYNTEEQKRFCLSQPNTLQSHLQVKWMLLE